MVRLQAAKPGPGAAPGRIAEFVIGKTDVSASCRPNGVDSIDSQEMALKNPFDLDYHPRDDGVLYSSSEPDRRECVPCVVRFIRARIVNVAHDKTGLGSNPDFNCPGMQSTGST